MNCDRARRLFGACWDDELTLAEREWLEGHFTACDHCRTEYDGFSRTLELAGALPRAEASADLVERVLARARRTSTVPDRIGEAGTRPEPDLPARDGTAVVLRWVPVAAAAAVLVVAALFVVPRMLVGPAGPGDASRVSVEPGRAAAPDASVRPDGQGVVQMAAVRMPSRRTTAGGPVAAVPDSVFDHSEDVEFILDPVTLHRGRASVARGAARSPGVEGGQAIITF